VVKQKQKKKAPERESGREPFQFVPCLNVKKFLREGSNRTPLSADLIASLEISRKKRGAEGEKKKKERKTRMPQHKEDDFLLPPLLTMGAPSPLPDCHERSRFVDARDYNTDLASSTFIHRSAFVYGEVTSSPCLVVGSESLLRSDLAKISLGTYVTIGSKSVVKPPFMPAGSKVEARPVSIGDYTQIGSKVVCEALCVGNFVIIEDGAVIGAKAMISHGCWIRQGAVVPPQVTLVPFAVYEGNPCKIVAMLQEDAHVVLVRERQRQILTSLIIG
jgi:carbonic anhydrase/acetyltransferase-like protein (isoleucine patch superfamily)